MLFFPGGQAAVSWTSRTAPPTHSAFLDSLVRAVEEEGAEQGDAGAVVQDGQVHLRELEGCWVLFQQLPNAVKEHQEQRRLGKETRNFQGLVKHPAKLLPPAPLLPSFGFSLKRELC